MYDLAIVGGGPAGIAAGIYAARKKIKTILISDSFGGQSVVSDNIENWIGIKSIPGWEFAKQLEEHLRAQKGIEILEEKVSEVSKKNGEFSVKTSSGKEIETKTILACSGGRHRRLNVPGEEKFEGKGVVFCSTCDAPLFKGKETVVVGGGNAGLEAAADIIPYASKIYLLEYADRIKGDPVTFEAIKKSGKVEVILNADVKEILGSDMVSGVKYADLVSNKEKELSVQGVFVEIGMAPNSDMIKNLVKLNEKNEIKVDSRTGRSSLLGVWAAGDVSDALYKQNNIAAGDAIRAALNIHEYLREKDKGQKE